MERCNKPGPRFGPRGRLLVASIVAGVLMVILALRPAHAASAAKLATEKVAGEGIWLDPLFQSIRDRTGRVMVTVWFDRQLLGDGEAYRRRAVELKGRKRRELREAAVAALKELSRTSHAAAAEKLAALEASGKLRSIQRHWIVNGFTAVVSIDAIDELKQVPGVKKIFVARRRAAPRRQAQKREAVTYPEAKRTAFRADQYRHPWYTRYLLADKVWREFGVTGRGTLNVVHDFGFSFGPNVTRNLYRNPKEIPGNGKDDDGNGWVDDYHGYNFDADSPVLSPPAPRQGTPQSIPRLHGVLCAAIICGAGQPDSPFEFGLAPEARWAAVIGSQRLEAAIEWAVEQGADTYSMSFSIPGLGEYRSHWRKIMEHGSLCGVYFVSGAGNFAQQVPVPVQMRTPEDIPNVVFAAAGVQRDLSRTPFSSKGPVVWLTEHYRDGRVAKPEVCAFNAGLPVQYPDGKVAEAGANGNSFAGPMFCGSIALMLSADPDLLPWDLKEIIKATATDVGPPGVDDETGHGLINVYRAVKEVLRRRALREGTDPSRYEGRVPGDEIDVLRIRKLGENVRLVVRRVQPNSQAAQLGLRPGDVLVKFGGREITSLADFQKARRGATRATKLVVRRNGKEQTLSVSPGPLGIAIVPTFSEPVFQ